MLQPNHNADGTRIRPEAAAYLREEIRLADGNEVFAVGRLDEQGWVVELAVHCRGGPDSVLALPGRAKPGEVVVHNHPSGVLLPSDADLELAGRFGQEGVGFLIVDNVVGRANWVVEAHAPKRKPVNLQVVRDFFEKEVPRVVEGCEPRPTQTEMALAVTKALNEGEIATVEAGTGTGKSLAYLVPAGLWALENEGRVVVATYTLTLQAQLASSDLPVLTRAGLPLKASVLKGRNNYLCRRRLAEAKEEASREDDPERLRLIEDIVRFADTALEGTRQDLAFPVDDEVWESVESDHDQTLRARCPHFDQCFYYKARREAAQSQILVVNHHLLLADRTLKVATGGEGILPAYDRVVIDEGHHLEDAATSALKAALGDESVVRALRPLLPRKRRRGALESLEARFTGSGSPLLPEDRVKFGRILDTLRRRLPALEDAARGMSSVLSGELPPEGALRVTDAYVASDAWTQAVKPVIEELISVLTAAHLDAERLADLLADLPTAQRLAEPQPVFDLGRASKRFAEQAKTAASFLEGGPSLVRFIQQAGRGAAARRAGIAIAPIEVGPLLRTQLFEPLQATVLTSATLTVNGHFTHYQERIGLWDIQGDAPTLPDRKLVSGIFLSPFDYQEQAVLGLPRDLPEPDSPEWWRWVGHATAEAVKRAGGGAFVLCTSHEAVNRLHTHVSRLVGPGFPLLRQGEMGRTRLLERFRDLGNAVLFGTDSFWEGVSVRGEALRLVIIPKLPFRVPTEPVQQARHELLEARGLDPFRAYTLPQAVLRLRQGVGRLIRARSDRGAVLILDRRVHDRWYGRIFLQSLPEMRRVVGPTRAVLDALSLLYGSLR